MLDNALFRLIKQVLSAGLSAIGQGSIKLVQSYQPTQQGLNSAPTVYLYKIGVDTNVGFPQKSTQKGIGSASFRGSISGSILTVTNITAGALALYQMLGGANIPPNLIITGFGTGTGGLGTYILSHAPPAIAAQSMTSAAAFVRIETQQKSSLFQATALVTQNPADTESLTASDVANLACYVMQSVPTIATLEAQGVGVLRIPLVRNPYFSDDRQRYEAAPSFDFTLTHKQTIILSAQIITEIELQVLEV